MSRPGIIAFALALSFLGLAIPNEGLAQDPTTSNLTPLVTFLRGTDNPQIQKDVLKGMVDALKGVTKRPMPEGWESLESSLANSESAEIRTLARTLAVKFGSVSALETLREIATQSSNSLASRQNALATLIAISDEQLTEILLALVSDKGLRSQAIRGLAKFSDHRIPIVLIALYPQLNLTEKQDVISSLASRETFAAALLDAIDKKSIPSRDLTAAVIRQLRNLKSELVTQKLQTVWGAFREPSKDKLAEIERYRNIYRAGGSTPGKASEGRTIFVRTCQQCHSLFGMGGSIGPDITGSDRSNLTYLLQNIVDPNGVIPNEYQTSTVETADDRVLTGIIGERNAAALTITTANETLTIPINEVIDVQASSLSMMPEGLLTALTDQEVRDLLYYLRQPAQAPLLGSKENLNLFFNGVDLTGWDGNPDLWTVENGTIIGKSARGLGHNEFLTSQMQWDDFRLTLEVKLTPNAENSGIQFRSRPQSSGEVKGYQADIGKGWWGKLYEELGRGLLWDQAGDIHVKPGDWNTYEILARGHRIKTALNGNLCVDLEDNDGDLQGMIALQLHSGGPMEVQFRNLQIEIAPLSNELKSVKK